MRKYSRRSFLKFSGLGAAALMAPKIATVACKANRRPNIIFFLVDDMGWMDSSLYGSKYYETPNVERLAQRGMMFTDAYAASPVCSPTRASILTGKYPCRLKITSPAGHLTPQTDTPLIKEYAAPWFKMVCPRSRRFLRLEEYTIAEAFKDADYATGFIGKWHLGHEPWWPKKQGFDINIAGGHYHAPPSYFSPYRIKTLKDGARGEYITDRLTDEALRYLDEHRARPFFLCFWHYAVHNPFQAKDELTKKYRGKNDPRSKQNCPIMGAMLQSMDESVGRLLDKLDALRIADKTIIIFMSDNGGNMLNEIEDTTPTNNHPLRGGKGTIYEGGTRVPCIVVWPDVVRPGSKCIEVISSIDFYPTMLEMTGIEKKKDHQTDGESIVPLLKGTGKLKREAIFCHFPHYQRDKAPPCTYVRKGDWKLIRFYGEGPNQSYAYELYNLRENIGETKNLADKMPEKVRELDALITEHLKDTGAIVPIPNPRYRPKSKDLRYLKPVHGWRPSRYCELSVRNGILQVNCTGNNPSLHTTKVPDVDGPVVLKMRIKCATRGDGRAFWNTTKAHLFHQTRRVILKLPHDDQWHDVSVLLPVNGKLSALRLNLGSGPGPVEIDWIRLCKPGGTILKAWSF